MKYLAATIGLLFWLAPVAAQAQRVAPPPAETIAAERPNVKAYLDYLKQELTVTDERISQREVSQSYIRHNFNRVSALRSFALKMARETDNDYIPEMEAVTQKEFHILFPENAPTVGELKTGEVYNFSYRYLGSARAAETFYIFARLDPYEEEQVRRAARQQTRTQQTAAVPGSGKPETESPAPEKSSTPAARENQPAVAADKNAQKTETAPPRDFLVTAEEKKKETFLKKNPQN